MTRLVVICCFVLVACSDTKQAPQQTGETKTGAGETKTGASETKTRAGKTITLVNPTIETEKMKAAAKRARAATEGLGKLLARPLTSADVKAYIAIRTELAPHRKLLLDRATRTKFKDKQDEIAKKHGIANTTAYSVIASRIRAANMFINMKSDLSKLNAVKRGDVDIVTKHVTEIRAALKAR